MAETVDRLLCVADREQVFARDRLDELELDLVGVLQLVDHHVLETLAVALAQLASGTEQLAGHELQVLEIEPRAVALALRVALTERAQQTVEQAVGALRETVLA